jgi:hypothetical protein
LTALCASAVGPSLRKVSPKDFQDVAKIAKNEKAALAEATQITDTPMIARLGRKENIVAKRVRFLELELINFTSHRKQKVSFGNITRLSGQNGQGKTSIGTAPVWILYGNDLQGKTFNPSPLNYEFDRVFAALLLSVDGVDIKFAREIDEKGKNAFYINDVPTKAKEYDAAVAALFDKDEFLALYNPSYFFTLHWTKQREMILRYTTPPAKTDVLAEMSRTNPEQKVKDIVHNPAVEKLAELTKKHSLDELTKIHSGTGGQKSKLEKALIAAQSRTKTLQEQLDRLGAQTIDIEQANAESAALLEQIKTIDKVTDSADKTNRKRSSLQASIDSLKNQIHAAKERYMAEYNEPIDDTCPSCKQVLNDVALKAVTDAKEKRKEKLRTEHGELVEKRKQLVEDLAELEFIDVTEQLQQIRELERRRDALEDAIHEQQNRERLAIEVKQAKADETATHVSLKESIFILDAIKAYRAKEAELQATKVQSLFTKLSIRLFKYVKSTEEYEPDFSVQMHGKDYVALSVGEKITAGLELGEVLFKQSQMITPVFIDGIGEYTGEIAVYDQLITGRAVPNQELKIETEE